MDEFDFGGAARQYWSDLIALDTTAWALLVVVIIFLLFLMSLFKSKPKKVRAFSQESGCVYITRKAVENMVCSACSQIEGVGKVRAELQKCRGGVRMEVKIRLETSDKLPYLSKNLQSHLTEVMTKQLGIEKFRGVTISVTDIKAEPISSFTEKPKVEEPVESELALVEPEDDLLVEHDDDEADDSFDKKEETYKA